jgi:hypothetical protein
MQSVVTRLKTRTYVDVASETLVSPSNVCGDGSYSSRLYLRCSAIDKVLYEG